MSAQPAKLIKKPQPALFLIGCHAGNVYTYSSINKKNDIYNFKIKGLASRHPLLIVNNRQTLLNIWGTKLNWYVSLVHSLELNCVASAVRTAMLDAPARSWRSGYEEALKWLGDASSDWTGD
jgi:hypothetical protein